MEEQKEQQRYQTLQEEQQQAQTDIAAEAGLPNVCPHCKTINEPDALFCEECGTALGHSKLCPHCSQPLDLLADFCEHCKSYVCPQRCSFCGASIAETDAFCPECGASREGVICPACQTRNPFSYCRVCGIPLTEEAIHQSKLAHEEPMWKQMEELSTELEILNKIIPARIAAKRKELQDLLDAIAVQPQENPVLTRNFVMARKPVSNRIGWKCNFKQVVHSSPCGCACPQLGGKWVVLGNDTKVEDDF